MAMRFRNWHRAHIDLILLLFPVEREFYFSVVAAEVDDGIMRSGGFLPNAEWVALM